MPHALELVGRQNRGTLQRVHQVLAADRENLRIRRGHDALVIRKLAFDQLGNQLDLAEA